MCPACLTTAAVVAAGSVSGVGVLGHVAVKYGWLQRFRRRTALTRIEQEHAKPLDQR